MQSAPKIHVLRSGPHLAPLLCDAEVLYWTLCATGQAFSPDDALAPPASIEDLNLVEPLGGNLLHLVLRPSLKHLDVESRATPVPIRSQLPMLERLAAEVSPSDAQWIEILKARDLFGLRAVDYYPEINVLRGKPLEQSVSDEAERPKNARGIIMSLIKDDMLNCDLFYGLKKAREFAGIDLFPGINSRNPSELRFIILRYFDLLHRTLDRTA